MVEVYPVKGDEQRRDVRKCLTLIEDLGKVADRLPKIPRGKEFKSDEI